MQVLTREQSRAVDRLAIEMGMFGVVMMENAGRRVAEVVLDVLEAELHLVAPDARVAVLCGGGNNGGDGYVIARHLANAGVQVTAYRTATPHQQSDAAINLDLAEQMGLVEPMENPDQLRAVAEQVEDSHVIVDALLGTGFSGEVRPFAAEVIRLINDCRARGARVVAVDLPSGLDCDTGQPAQATVEADVTVTFVAMKVGFAQPPAPDYLGEVVVADIGVPRSVIERATSL